MSTDTYALEPFPTFVDTVDPSKVSYFTKMGLEHLLQPSGAMYLHNKQRTLFSNTKDKLSLYYYQYEVTVGLYMLTYMEKLILHTIFLSILTLFSFGIYYGLQPFIVKSICQVLYYVYGSLSGVEEICSDLTCP